MVRFGLEAPESAIVAISAMMLMQLVRPMQRSRLVRRAKGPILTLVVEWRKRLVLNAAVATAGPKSVENYQESACAASEKAYLPW